MPRFLSIWIFKNSRNNKTFVGKFLGSFIYSIFYLTPPFLSGSISHTALPSIKVKSRSLTFDLLSRGVLGVLDLTIDSGNDVE